MEIKKTTILIIEDNEEIRESTAEILELADYLVLTAEEGKTGVDLALKHFPDLILCDIMMPELDGYGVLYMLSKHKETARIPFIFLTAKAERADIRKAMEMGADDYLTKPFDDIELLNAIESRLKKRNQITPMQELQDKLDSHENQVALLEDLIATSRVKTFRKKQLIYQEKDSPLYLYFIKKGKVRSFLYYLDGRELSTGIFSENNFFGYESLMLQQRYSDCTETLEETEVVLINKDRFFEILYRKPAIASQFIKLLSGNVREKEEQLLGFAYDTVRKRVANSLIQVAEKTMTDQEQDECLIRISRDDLAALAGTANETISRMLSDFKDEKLITKEGNAIRILSMKRLRNIKQ